jgi:hypothetical protein
MCVLNPCLCKCHGRKLWFHTNGCHDGCTGVKTKIERGCTCNCHVPAWKQESLDKKLWVVVACRGAGRTVVVFGPYRDKNKAFKVVDAERRAMSEPVGWAAHFEGENVLYSKGDMYIKVELRDVE